MKLIVIGPQASGKSTQAEILAKRLGLQHLSTGTLLRDEQRAGTVLGTSIGVLIDQGKLVPTKIIWELLEPHLGDAWVLDGFPRTAEQAKLLEKTSAPDRLLLLAVSDSVCIERISGRRICAKAGHEYHIKYKPSKKTGICDTDGSRLVQRPDDHESAVSRRLAAYHERTEPVLSFYKKRVTRINGDQGINEVADEIKQALAP